MNLKNFHGIGDWLGSWSLFILFLDVVTKMRLKTEVFWEWIFWPRFQQLDSILKITDVGQYLIWNKLQFRYRYTT